MLAALNADATGQSGINLRGEVAATQISLSGNTVRLTLQAAAATSGFTVDSMYFGKPSGTGPDFSGDQVQVFVGGSGSFTVGVNSSVVTDPFSYTLDETLNAMWAGHLGGAASSIRILNDSNFLTYFKVSGTDESALTVASGYSLISGQARLLSKIEVFA